MAKSPPSKKDAPKKKGAASKDHPNHQAYAYNFRTRNNLKRGAC